MIIRQAITFLILLSVAAFIGCEIDTKVSVTKDNPPKFTFSGNGILAQMCVSGPFTLDEIKLLAGTEGRLITKEESLKIDQVIGGRRTLWQLDPGRGKYITDLPVIIYGELPKGFRQVYPKDNSATSPLLEGKYYMVSAPSHNANNHTAFFMVKNGNCIQISVDEILKSDSGLQ